MVETTIKANYKIANILVSDLLNLIYFNFMTLSRVIKENWYILEKPVLGLDEPYPTDLEKLFKLSIQLVFRAWGCPNRSHWD